MNNHLPYDERIVVLIPENIKIEIILSLSPGLQSLLQKLVDQQDDRAAAAKLAAEVAGDAKALADAIPKP